MFYRAEIEINGGGDAEDGAYIDGAAKGAKSTAEGALYRPSFPIEPWQSAK